jgi:large subunit ribosomal protein L20
MRARHTVASKKRKKKILKLAKGFWGKRSKVIVRAKESVRKALVYAYRDRRRKKREFRSLWITRINAAARERGLTYREFIHGLKKKNIILSRDMLASLACEEPKVFDKLVEMAKGK